MKFSLGLVLLLLPAFLVAVEPAQREEIKSLLRDKKWLEAQTLLKQVVAAEPMNAEAYFFLGQSFLYSNDAAQALPALEKAVELDPTNSRYVRHLGDACGMTAQKAGLFAKMGWAKKCKAAYDKAVELDPKDIAARWSVMEYCRQAPGFLGGGMEGAYVQAAEIKKIDSARGCAAYLELYLADKKNAEALALADEVIKQKADDYQTLYQIGKLADTTGQELDRGLAALRRCLTISPPGDNRGYVPAHWRIGNILAQKGDKAAARAAYEAALALNPQFPEAIASLAKLAGKG